MAMKQEVDVRFALVQLRIDAICRFQMVQHPSELSRNWYDGMETDRSVGQIIRNGEHAAASDATELICGIRAKFRYLESEAQVHNRMRIFFPRRLRLKRDQADLQFTL